MHIGHQVELLLTLVLNTGLAVRHLPHPDVFGLELLVDIIGEILDVVVHVVFV